MPHVFRPSNLAVYICSHVFDASRPVLLVVHEQDDFMFLCGGDDHDKDVHVVGIEHLIERDSTLNECADLPAGFEAERSTIGAPWLRVRFGEVAS